MQFDLIIDCYTIVFLHSVSIFQQQYGQQMQQATPMMEMRRNVHQQGPQY